MTSALIILLPMVTLFLSGCAAIPVAAVATSAFGGGTQAAVKAGTEYARNGVVYRTFSLPLRDVRLVLGDTLARMEIAVVHDEPVGDEQRIRAEARDREVDLRLEPVTRTVTRLRLVVSEGLFRKDRATASEIVAQMERQLEAQGAASAGARIPPTGAVREAGASCPAPVARRSETPRARSSSPCRDSDDSRPRSTSTRAE